MLLSRFISRVRLTSDNMKGIIVCILLTGLSVRGLEFGEPEVKEIDPLLVLSTTEASFSELEHAITLGDAPEQLTVIEDTHLQDNLTSQTPTTIFSVEYPDNHKNFTPSPFIGSIEVPPLLNQYNAYQQQYKAYYQQKEDFKPVKFEANAGRNQYVGSYLENSEARPTHESYREPFPYLYDSERVPLFSPTHWGNQKDFSHDYRSSYGINYYHKGNGHKGHHHLEEGEHYKVGAWDKVLKLFTTLVPLGLLLASFTPTVIAVNSTVDQPAKQRSLDGLSLMHPAGAACEYRAICEMAVMGRNENGAYMEKSLWKMVNSIPDSISELLGMKEAFDVIRRQECEVYKCNGSEKKEAVRRVKKVLRKKKD